MEHVPRDERDEDREVEDAETHDEHEAEDQRDPRRVERVTEPLPDLLADCRGRARPRRALHVDEEERADHHEE